MATTASLTTSPTTIDSGVSDNVSVTNTGSVDVVVSRGSQSFTLRAGQGRVIYPEGAAVTAATVSGAGSVSYTATAARLSQVQQFAADPAFSGTYAPVESPAAALSTTLAHRYLAGLQGYNITASSLRFWRAALARQRVGGAMARLHCYGDSITWGLFQTDPLETKSYPDRLRTLLNGVWGSTYEGPIWFSKPQTGSGATNTDTRITLGTSWAYQSGGATQTGPGGATTVQNTSTTSAVTFGPVTCDSFTIYYLGGTGIGNFSWAVDGGSATTVTASSGTVGPRSVTFSAGSVGSHTLSIANITGARLYAVEYDDSTRPAGGVKVSRLGTPGQTSADWANDTATYKSLAPAFDVVSPDLTCLMSGSNDYNTNLDPAVYFTNMAAIVDRARSKNGDVLLMVPPPMNATGKTYAIADYRRRLYALADAKDVPLLDIADRWPAYATANASPFSLYADAAHPSDRGYYDLAQAVSDLLRRAA